MNHNSSTQVITVRSPIDGKIYSVRDHGDKIEFLKLEYILSRVEAKTILESVGLPTEVIVQTVDGVEIGYF